MIFLRNLIVGNINQHAKNCNNSGHVQKSSKKREHAKERDKLKNIKAPDI